MLSGPQSSGAQATGRPKPAGKLNGKMSQAEHSVPGAPVRAVPVSVPAHAPGATYQAPIYPNPATVDVVVPAPTGPAAGAPKAGAAGPDSASGLTAAGATGVSVGPARVTDLAAVLGGRQAASPGPVSSGSVPVTVSVAAHSAAAAAGVDGTLVSVARSDGQTASASVQVAVDYSSFAQAFGGDFGGRLKLVAMPACALTTPQLAQCRQQSPVAFTNDSGGRRLVSTVVIPGAATASPQELGAAAVTDGKAAGGGTKTASAPKLVLAATSSTTSSSGTGSYAATSLSASNNWGTGGNSGSFTYSYPIAMPAALGGAAPSVALAYDSGSIDGKTAVENSQPSWVGDGWDYNPGFIERATVPCSKAKPTAFANSTDNCFARDASGKLLPAFSISFNGHGNVLIADDSDSSGTTFKTQHDDGTRVMLLTGSPSATADPVWRGEYFRVQTPDGSVAYFGADQLPAELNGGTWGTDTPTQSEDLEPIFNNPNNSACGDPNTISTAAGITACRTTYRWQLDYVVDPHGDVTKYLYSREGDTSYQHWYTNASTYLPANYTRATTLKEIDYSWQTADVVAGHIPGAKAVFNPLSRCVDPVLPNGQTTPYSTNAGAGAPNCSTSSSYLTGFNDTPTDLSSVSNTTNPAFWTRYRLGSIDTYTTVGSTPNKVDHYDLFYQFHDLKDNATTVKSPLWLQAIRHCAASAATTATGGICPANTGAAGQLSTPDVQFTGTSVGMVNRVPGVKDANGTVITSLSTYPRERIGDIYTELGAQIAITYDDPANFASLGCTMPPTSQTPAVPADWHNHQLCFPEYWTPPTFTAPITDWFHKYVVTSVKVTDESSSAHSHVLTSYNYDASGAAWHSNDSELVADNHYRVYDQYQGFGTITTTNGEPYSLTQDKGHPQTQTVSTYLRGMDQDMDLVAFNSGGAGGCNGTGVDPAVDCPNISISDGQGGSTQDDVIFAGTLLETKTFQMPDNSVTTPTLYSDSVSRPWKSDPIASHTRTAPLPTYRSRQTGTAITVASVPLAAGGGAQRVTTTEYFHDQANGGRIAYVDTLAPTPADSNDPELCTSTGYAQGTPSQLRIYLEYADSSTVTTGPCLSTAGPVYSGAFPAGTAGGGTVVSGTLSWYDANYTVGSTHTDAVGVGDVVETDALVGAAGTPGTMTKQGSATFDRYGRVLTATDALGNVTSTAYNPVNGTQPTSTTVTGPGVTDTFGTATRITKAVPGFTSTTAYNLRGEATDVTDANNRVTHIEYDDLGRTLAGWAPDHPKSVYNSTYNGAATYLNQPSAKYSYTVSGQPAGLSTNTINPSVVETDKLREDGTYAPSLTLLDSLGRTRQAQTVPISGDSGRVVTDTVYDTLGRVDTVSGPQYDSATVPTGQYYVPTANAQTVWYQQAQTLYDGLGRTTDAVSLSQAAVLWKTHTDYHGADRIDVTPPAGGTATSTITDARGHAEQLYTYHATASVPFGTTDPLQVDIVKYGYDAAGRQNLVTDAANHQWSTVYDLLGRKTSFTDPDSGTSTFLYDADGRVTDTQDARGAAGALHTVYDSLGRKTGEYNQYNPASLDPTKLQSTFTYDSLDNGTTFGVKGQATSSTRYSNGQAGPAYTEATTSVDLAYRPLTSQVSIPNGDGNGALAGTYKSTNVYTPLTGLLDHTVLPAVGNAATGGLAADTVTNGYSPNGLLTMAGDNFGDLLSDSGYTPFGEIQRRIMGDYPSQVVSDTVYDAATRRIANTTLSQLAWNRPVDTTAYLYDQAGKITAAIDEQATATSTGGNGIVSTSLAIDTQCYAYDYAARLLSARTDSTVPDHSLFGHVTLGTVGGSNTAVPPDAPLNGDLGSCTTATPNSNNRAAATAEVNSGPAPYWQTFSYDNATGNRQVENDYDPAGTTSKDTTTNFKYENAAQPYTLTSRQVNSAPATTYGYDPAGNTTSRPSPSGTDGLNWNAEGRLDNETTAPGGGTVKTSFVYDASGAQLIRRDPATNTTSLYLGTAEIHLNTQNNTITGNRYFSFSGAPTVIESGGTNPTLTYEAGNLQGTSSVTIAASPNGAASAVTARRAYTPFNTPRTAAATGTPWNQAFPDDHTFLGKTTDTSTGLVDVGARKYDPIAGRFISADPIFQPNDPQAIGGYSYASNDPTNKVDPSGLSGMKAPIYGDGGGSEGNGSGCPFATNGDGSCKEDPTPKKPMTAKSLGKRMGLDITTYSNDDGSSRGVMIVQHKSSWSQFWDGVGNALFESVGGPDCQHAGDGDWPESCRQSLAMAVGTLGLGSRVPKQELSFDASLPWIEDATWGGRVQYGPLDEWGRATGVAGMINKDMLKKGTEANSNVNPVGFLGGQNGDARGHLLAGLLGGSGDIEENLVPLIQNPVNSPVMRDLEGQIRDAVESRNENVQYTVKPIYQDLTGIANPTVQQLRPIGITMEAYGDGGFQLAVSVINK
ncbi:RHS repeat-associated core domain-containing protein [Catenulispora subtropica]|uniref:RHS repeat-associated core domain-containing protein n=1 Tax=Catenulispora subtropica TaxID=450798 RepID=A0ABP5EG01_9ACTN